jgi:hypothetical protein
VNKILVTDSPTISVWIYPQRKMVHHEMKAYCYGPEFRDALTKGADALRLHKATKWLADARLSRAIPKDDDDWVTSVWLPQTTAAGWKYWAIIPPNSVISQIRLGRISKIYADFGVETHMFATVDEAMKWLDKL